MAKGSAAEAARLAAEALAVEAQINVLGDTQQPRSQAQARVDTLNQSMTTQATRENNGAGVRLAALFQAAREDWGVVFMLAFMLGVYMLPDFIAWLALGHAPGGKNGPEGTYALLKDIDRKQTALSLNAFTHRTVQAGSQQLPVMDVKLGQASARPAAQAGPRAAPQVAVCTLAQAQAARPAAAVQQAGAQAAPHQSKPNRDNCPDAREAA